MTLAEIVATFRYKPGWHFHLETGPTRGHGTGCLTWMSYARDCPVSVPVTSASGWAATAAPVRLVVVASVQDSFEPGLMIESEHPFNVPAVGEQDGRFWRRWLLDRIRDVETHEICEFFEVGGVRAFYPEHGPDANLYAIEDRLA